jgi:hypothetical protein
MQAQPFEKLSNTRVAKDTKHKLNQLPKREVNDASSQSLLPKPVKHGSRFPLHQAHASPAYIKHTSWATQTLTFSQGQ